MSRPTVMSSTSIATIWPSYFEDKYGKKVYGDPYTVACCVKYGGSSRHVDSKGVEFTPTVTVWFELSSAFNNTEKMPSEGDYIAIGDYIGQQMGDGNVVPNALPIKLVEIDDCSSIGEIDDIRIVV